MNEEAECLDMSTTKIGVLHPVRLALVIPTRHRADLCLLAVDSVRRQSAPCVRLVVSENSGADENRSSLSSRLPSDVELLIPDDELSMSAHWEWALQETELRLRPTHIAFLTDRMVFRNDCLMKLVHLVERHPCEIISYGQNWVDDYDESAVRIGGYRGDGRLYAMDSRSILGDTASGRHEQGYWLLPKMLNSVTPVDVFSEMRKETGHVFASVAPDLYFAYRVLAMRDQFLCVNESFIVDHTRRRSTGLSFVTGSASRDGDDFRAFTPVSRWETPFPTVTTIGNAVFHEYGVVRKLAPPGRFPPVDAVALRSILLRDAGALVDVSVANEIRLRLGASAELPPRSQHRLGRMSRQALSLLRHPRRVLGWRVTYWHLPGGLLRQLYRLLPGGTFASSSDALSVARSRPHRSIRRRRPPSGARWQSKSVSKMRIFVRLSR